MRRYKHLTPTDRIRIEDWLKEGYGACEIARRLHVHNSTIYRELKRGRYEHLNGDDWTTEERYSPDIAEQKYRANLAAKGAQLKIGKDHRLAQHIEKKIAEDGYSPAAVLGEIKRDGLQFSTMICTTTLYSYIDKRVFLKITNKDLPMRGKRRKPYRHVRPARAPRGESIEKRPEEINARTTFGHWEMDCVEGKQKTKRTALVFTERLTRYEIIVPIPRKTAACVVTALDQLERRYGKMFKRVFRTITVDNGTEFSDCAGLERSCRTKGARTKVYYCHPYSSYERGSNEKQNNMIRRKIPKGTNLENISTAKIKAVEQWLNGYPRAMFDWHTSEELFCAHVASLI